MSSTLVDEYSGVDDAEHGKWLATQVGDASGILLAHHGAIVTGTTIGETCYKAVTFERMCHLTYDILAAGLVPRDVPVGATQRAQGDAAPEHTRAAYWEGAVRLLLAKEPEVLE